MQKKVRYAQTTVLIVGEGATEVAFLKFLRSKLVTRGCGVSVKIENAYGKGPENVLDTVCGHQKHASYDISGALLDTDIPWTKDLNSEAHLKNIILIGAQPCIEGLFLRLKGMRIDRESRINKKRWNDRYKLDFTDQRSFEHIFNFEEIESQRKDITEIDTIINIIKAIRPK